jgi:hypothetical protein
MQSHRRFRSNGENDMTRIALGIALVAASAASSVSAQTLFSNKAAANDPSIFTANDVQPYLEDVRFSPASQAAGYQVTGINVGFDNNILSGTRSFDVLVRFFDNVDYTAATVNTGPLGSIYRFSIVGALPGGDETGMLTLPSGGFVSTDDSVGVLISFVLPNTNTVDSTVRPLIKDIPIGVGSSSGLFGLDSDNDGVVTSPADVFTWAGGGFPDANLYLEIGGTVIPEPATLGLLGFGAAALMLRRRK